MEAKPKNVTVAHGMANLRQDHLIRLDHDSGLPLYLQIAHQLMYEIETGIIRKGDKLPSTRTLASDLAVAVLTVDKAYRWLKTRGVVLSHRGKGWTVAVSMETSSEEQHERIKMAKIVDKILDSVVNRGFDPMTFAQALLRRATAMQRRIRTRRLVFIECHSEYVNDFIAKMEQELAGFNVQIQGILTSSLPTKKGRNPNLQGLSEADFIMTTLYHYEHVQRMVAPSKQRVVALTHTIDETALFKIVSLPREMRLGALFGPVDPAPVIVQTLESYRDVPGGSIPFALISDRRAVKKVLSNVDVIAYTAACEKQIRSLVGKDNTTILMRFVPDEDALRKIRTLLGASHENSKAPQVSRTDDLMHPQNKHLPSDGVEHTQRAIQYKHDERAR
jgi:DNA-binding transcriptional regulator YhcF (GntR family)